MSLADLSVDLETRFDLRAKRAVGIDPPIDLFSRSFSRHMAPGNSGKNRANQLYHAMRSLGAFGSETLNLDGTGAGGTAITNAFGEAIAFTSISVVLIRATTSQLTVGNAAAQPWAPMFNTSVTDTWRVPVAASMLRYNPQGTWTVSASSRNLLIGHGSPSGTTYDIILIGRVA